MAWTQSDLDALEKSIATGVLEVQYSDGRRVRYQSLADMLRLRSVMTDAIAANGSPTPRTSYVQHNRG